MKTYRPIPVVLARASIHGVKLYNRNGRTGFAFQAENRSPISPGQLRIGARPSAKLNCVLAGNATLNSILFRS